MNQMIGTAIASARASGQTGVAKEIYKLHDPKPNKGEDKNKTHTSTGTESEKVVQQQQTEKKLEDAKKKNEQSLVNFYGQLQYFRHQHIPIDEEELKKSMFGESASTTTHELNQRNPFVQHDNEKAEDYIHRLQKFRHDNEDVSTDTDTDTDTNPQDLTEEKINAQMTKLESQSQTQQNKQSKSENKSKQLSQDASQRILPKHMNEKVNKQFEGENKQVSQLKVFNPLNRTMFPIKCYHSTA